MKKFFDTIDKHLDLASPANIMEFTNLFNVFRIINAEY